MECTIYQAVKNLPMSQKRIREAVFFVLKTLKKTGMVSIHLVGDKRIQKLNNFYRGEDRTTDVLAFATTEGKELVKVNNDFGDIFICWPQVKRQAKKYQIDFREEFIRMLVHGLLHLFGYDHIKKKQAVKMFYRQEKLVKKII